MMKQELQSCKYCNKVISYSDRVAYKCPSENVEFVCIKCTQIRCHDCSNSLGTKPAKLVNTHSGKYLYHINCFKAISKE